MVGRKRKSNAREPRLRIYGPVRRSRRAKTKGGGELGGLKLRKKGKGAERAFLEKRGEGTHIQPIVE